METNELTTVKKITNLDKGQSPKREYTNTLTGKPMKGMDDAKYDELRAQGHPLSNVKTTKIK